MMMMNTTSKMSALSTQLSFYLKETVRVPDGDIPGIFEIDGTRLSGTGKLFTEYRIRLSVQGHRAELWMRHSDLLSFAKAFGKAVPGCPCAVPKGGWFRRFSSKTIERRTCAWGAQLCAIAQVVASWDATAERLGASASRIFFKFLVRFMPPLPAAPARGGPQHLRTFSEQKRLMYRDMLMRKRLAHSLDNAPTTAAPAKPIAKPRAPTTAAPAKAVTMLRAPPASPACGSTRIVSNQERWRAWHSGRDERILRDCKEKTLRRHARRRAAAEKSKDKKVSKARRAAAAGFQAFF